VIKIDESKAKSIYEQIYDEFAKLIFLNVLKNGDKMPSVRELALILHINPNTIQKSYKLLEKDNFIESKKGKGNFVTFDTEAYNNYKNSFKEKLVKIIDELVKIGIDKNEIIKLVKERVNNA